MAMARLRVIAAGAATGAGAQLPNLTFIIELALVPKTEVAEKNLTEQNRDLQQIARRRQNIKQIESQVKQPDQLLIARAVGDKQKEYEARTERGGAEHPYNKNDEQPKKSKGGPGWKPGGKTRFCKGMVSERRRNYESERGKRLREGDDDGKGNRRRPKRRKEEDR